MCFDLELVNILQSDSLLMIKEDDGTSPNHATERLKTMDLKPPCLSNNTSYEEMDLPSSSRSVESAWFSTR